MEKLLIATLFIAFSICMTGCGENEQLSASNEKVNISQTPETSAVPTSERAWRAAASSKEVANQIKKVNTFFLTSNNAAPAKLPLDMEWKSATYHLGALEAFKATGDPAYYEYTLNWAENWGYDINYGQNTAYLDNAASMLVYTELHNIYPADRKLADSIRNADFTATKGVLNYSWIDEIYMVSSGYQYLARVTEEKKLCRTGFFQLQKMACRSV